MRCSGSLPLFAALLFIALAPLYGPGPAHAAPISRTYAITGGNAFGGFLGNADLGSGTVVVTYPTADPVTNTFTTAPTIAFDLLFTNLSTFKATFSLANIGSGFLNPATSISGAAFLSPSFASASLNGKYENAGATLLTKRHVRIQASGTGFSFGRYRMSVDTGGGLAFYGFQNLVGQEVPEVGTAGSMGAAVLMFGAYRLARTLRRRAPGAPRRA